MRIPMKPVSFMTSRMSVNGTRGNEFHRLEPSAHCTFLLAGRRSAARARSVEKARRQVRRVMTEQHITNRFTAVALQEGIRLPLSMNVNPLLLTGALLAAAPFLFAGDVRFDARGKVLFSDDFSGTAMDKGWVGKPGKWEMVDGAVKVSELPEDKHAA